MLGMAAMNICLIATLQHTRLRTVSVGSVRGVGGVAGVGGVGGVGGVECRGCLTMSKCFDSLDTTRALPLSRLLDTGVGVSGLSVGLVSVDTSVGVSGGVGRCRDRVSECRARAQLAARCTMTMHGDDP